MADAWIFWGSIGFSWSMFLWEQYLSWRQFKKYRDTVKRPENVEDIMDEDAFLKSRLYKLDRARFGFAASIWSELRDTVVLLTGLLPIFWSISGQVLWNVAGLQNQILQSGIFLCITSLISAVINIPWSLYDVFVIEEKHGFNKQTLGFFVKDTVKKLVVTLVIMVPVISVVIWIIDQGGRYFFLYVWLFMSAVIFFLMTIYPAVIAPLFDKYTLLPDGALKQKIEALASSLAFPLTKIYVVEGSKRSAHSNAYLYGLWKNKRIVLYDTLLQDYKPDTDLPPNESEEPTVAVGSDAKRKKMGMGDDEVVAVLGHELGHWKLNHTMWNLIIAELNLFFVFFLFGFMYKWRSLYTAFGFYTEQPTLIGLLIIFEYIFAPYNEVLSFAMTAWSRRMEFAADAFSAALGNARLLGDALIKLGRDNLSFPVNDWLYSFWHHDHPPIPERLDAIRKHQ